MLTRHHPPLSLPQPTRRQVVEEAAAPLSEYYRHISLGAWPFSTRDHGWPISDCSSEGLKAALTLAQVSEWWGVGGDGKGVMSGVVSAAALPAPAAHSCCCCCALARRCLFPNCRRWTRRWWAPPCPPTAWPPASTSFCRTKTATAGLRRTKTSARSRRWRCGGRSLLHRALLLRLRDSLGAPACGARGAASGRSAGGPPPLLALTPAACPRLSTLQIINPSETFGEIVVDYNHVECTSGEQA